MGFSDYVALGARLMEAAGVLTMLVGALIAGVVTLRRLRSDGARVAFRTMRHALGRSILLGLEFLVAADILRTVSEMPTLERVLVLAIIVAIRTFLSFSLELELEGKWPWQQRPPDQAR
jgi:uncharacterized membrane protein